MFYIPAIDDYLKILTKYFKSNEGKFYSKLCEEQNFRKAAESLYILTTPNEVEKYGKIQINTYDNSIHHYNIEIVHLSDKELQLINTKLMIKNKLKELLSDLKKFNAQTKLFLEYKKRNDIRKNIPFMC